MHRGLPLRRWLKLLLRRVDFPGWARCKEFAVAGRNLCMRRETMWAIHRYCDTSSYFKKHVADIAILSPQDFLSSPLAAGDASSIRAALRKNKILDKVKGVLRSIDFALRGVEGSDSERELFRLKFGALRIWNGCSFVFFTLNPHDIKTPLLVAFISPEHCQVCRVYFEAYTRSIENLHRSKLLRAPGSGVFFVPIEVLSKFRWSAVPLTGMTQRWCRISNARRRGMLCACTSLQCNGQPQQLRASTGRSIRRSKHFSDVRPQQAGSGISRIGSTLT